MASYPAHIKEFVDYCESPQKEWYETKRRCIEMREKHNTSVLLTIEPMEDGFILHDAQFIPVPKTN
jgi:hypothetical protein